MSEAAQAGRKWADEYWESADGLKLHYRDYPRTDPSGAVLSGHDDRPPILCIPGLTRNARDFEPVAEAFGGEWRVICLELRGRGESDYAKDPASYNPAQYVQDIAALFEQAGLDKVVAFGTSLGGIVTMLLATQMPERLAGVMLNDIGPVVEESGLTRIRDYVGQGRSYPTWMHAAWSLRDSAGTAYPDYAISDWLKLARKLMCVGSSGRITYDYDMKIAEPFSAPEASEPFDLWPAFRALAGRPVLALRGELSDILSDATLRKMASELPGLDAVTIPHVGHTPTLEELEALEAMARLLAKVA